MAVQGFGLTALVAQPVATSVISLAILWISASWTPSFNLSGKTLIDAVYAAEELEEAAKLFLTLRGSSPRVLTPAQVDELLETFG